MVNKKALLMVAAALVTALILSSLAVTRTARSQEETPVTLILLHIDGIPGESIITGYEHWIDIDAFAWGEAMASVTSVAGGRAAGKLNMTAFQFAMATDNASAMLFLACATGRYIAKTRLDVSRPMDAGPRILLRFDFAGVTISSYNIAGNTKDDHQNDQFGITFNKITMTYWQYDDQGNQLSVYATYYDLIAGRGGIAPLP